MSWPDRFKVMKKGLGLTNQKIAEITGNTRDSIQVVTGPSGQFPRWAKLAVWVWEKFTKTD